MQQPERRLVLLRHAAAEPFGATADMQRALTKAGTEQARELHTWLQDQQLHPQAVLASSALRVRQTAAHALGDSSQQVDFKDEFFSASCAVWLDAISKLDAEHKLVMLIGHNPTMSDLAIMLIGSSIRFSTCDLAVLSLDASWKSAAGNCTLITHRKASS